MTTLETFEKLPCAVYYKKKLFKTFESRSECAVYFKKKHTSQIGSTIARKGNIIYEGKKYAIRNWNPNKDSQFANQKTEKD